MSEDGDGHRIVFQQVERGPYRCSCGSIFTSQKDMERHMQFTLEERRDRRWLNEGRVLSPGFMVLAQRAEDPTVCLAGYAIHGILLSNVPVVLGDPGTPREFRRWLRKRAEDVRSGARPMLVCKPCGHVFFFQDDEYRPDSVQWTEGAVCPSCGGPLNNGYGVVLEGSTP